MTFNDPPIFAQTQRGELAPVRAYLASGGDPNARDQFSNTPLCIAASWGRAWLIAPLLAAGADIHARGAGGESIIAKAAQHGNAETVMELLKAKPDANAPGWDGCTAITWAVCKADKEMIEALLEAGADPFKKSNHGSCAYDQAALTPHRKKIFDEVWKAHVQKSVRVFETGLSGVPEISRFRVKKKPHAGP